MLTLKAPDLAKHIAVREWHHKTVGEACLSYLIMPLLLPLETGYFFVIFLIVIARLVSLTSHILSVSMESVTHMQEHFVTHVLPQTVPVHSYCVDSMCTSSHWSHIGVGDVEWKEHILMGVDPWSWILQVYGINHWAITEYLHSLLI